MSEHPTPAELEAFVQGNLPRGTFLKTARHLIRGCLSCKASLAPYCEVQLGYFVSRPAPGSEAAYDASIDRAFSAARNYKRYLRLEDARARKILALLEKNGSLAGFLSGTDLPLKGMGALKALLDRSWTIRYENPQEMVNLARHSVVIAETLNSRWCGPEEHADWQARTWGELGNAHRAVDDLDEAERAFGIAFEFFTQGTGDPYLKAKLYDLHASYLGTRRQFDLAFAALDIVHSTHLELGNPHLAGRALLVKAIYTHYSGRPEEAIRLNEQGLNMIIKAREPDLVVWAVHNQLWFLVALGRFRQARKELFRRRADFEQIGGNVTALKLRWLEAQIGAGLGEWSSSEQIFTEVKEGFENVNMGFAAALASLELGLVWMHQDRYKEAEEIVTEAAEVFVALRIQREAFGALMILTDAFKAQTATVALLESVVEHLRRSQIDPNAQFEPRWE